MHRFTGAVVLERHARLVRAVKVALSVLLLPVYVGCPFAWVFFIAILSGAERHQRRIANRLREAKTGTVTVEEESIVITDHEREERLALADLRGGFIEPARALPEGGFVAVLQLAGDRALLVRTESFDEANLLLEAAGIGPRQRTLHLTLGTAAAAAGYGPIMHLLGPWLVLMTSFACFGPLAVAAYELPVFGWLALSLAIMVWAWLMIVLARTILPVRCTIGNDAIVVDRLWQRRIIPISEIASIEVRPREIRLQRYAGVTSVEQLPTAHSPGDAGDDAKEALRWRIDQALGALRYDESGARYTALDRSDRPVSAWRKELAPFVAAGSYRTHDLASEELARIAESASAPADRRLGAALVLAQRGADRAQVERVRVAAQTLVDPRLRVALEKAVEGAITDDELEDAVNGRASLRV